MKCLRRPFILAALTLALLMPATAFAQEESEKLNTFTIDAELLTRGEIRQGGLPDSEEDNDN